MSTPWMHKHLLGLAGIPAGELRGLLLEAARLADHPRPPRLLSGCTVVNLFFEDSTRTRASFRLAAERLGAIVLDFAAGGSSVSKGETLLDTVRNLEVMGVDAFVVRHKEDGAPGQIADGVGASILNAGDGVREHPTQALLDAFTIGRHFGRADFDLSGLTVAIFGDVVHSRVAGSNLHSLTALGAKVILCGPPELVPSGFAAGRPGVEVRHDMDQVVQEADALYMLRIQFERFSGPAFQNGAEYHANWGLTGARLARTRPTAVVMHPGPLNRGIEIASNVADGPRSLILNQTANGVPVRMACLLACLRAAGRVVA